MNIFGQNPADITGALFKSKNFSDVPDKAAARNNLDVPSKADVQYNSVPVGMIMPFWGNVAPAGYLPCSGQVINSGTFPALVTFLGGTTTATVPDLRGEFLRGWDNGRGVDAGRGIASFQLDAFQGHKHYIGGSTTGNGVGAVTNSTNPVDTTYLGANQATYLTDGVNGTPRASTETRPRNAAVLYCIKAYSSISNYTSSVNFAGLISDHAALSAAAAKYADFTGTNQSVALNGWQKLPGGVIIQWGSWTPHATPGNSVAVLFPVAFPNGLRSLAVSANGNITTTTSSAWTSDGVNTGFNGRTNAATTSNCQYIAIGY